MARNGGQGDPRRSQPVMAGSAKVAEPLPEYLATFSEAVTNVDTGDFAVNGSTTENAKYPRSERMTQLMNNGWKVSNNFV